MLRKEKGENVFKLPVPKIKITTKRSSSLSTNKSGLLALVLASCHPSVAQRAHGNTSAFGTARDSSRLPGTPTRNPNSVQSFREATARGRRRTAGTNHGKPLPWTPTTTPALSPPTLCPSRGQSQGRVGDELEGAGYGTVGGAQGAVAELTD